MNFKKITIAGAGVLGSQVAWQTAFHGFDVTVYDAYDTGLDAGKKLHSQYAQLFKTERNVSDNKIEETFARLKYTTDLKKAVDDCDLLNESVPEIMKIKRSFYTNLAAVAPKKTIFTTNSSSMVPSQFVNETGRPDKFLALHFANGIWDANIGEIMGHPKTDQNVFDQVVEFAKAIGMVPIILRKEQPGYVVNSLLIPLLISSVGLLANGVSDVESIDKTWMISMDVKKGPFALIDMVGLETVYNVFRGLAEQPEHKSLTSLADFIKTQYLDKGYLGEKSNKGFYTHPNPIYANENFLS